jgi:regulator of sigma E protease
MTFQEIISHLGDYALLTIVFLLMISALVAAHELGHYLFARLFGMGVEEYAIGFGKKPLFTWMRRTYHVRDPRGEATGDEETTDFTVRPWPLGGFVRIKGMMPEDDGSEVSVPGGFYSKPPWQRLIVLLAGPAFSVIFGILILASLYMSIGIEKANNSPVFYSIIENGPAYNAGVKLGDRIVSLDGHPVSTFYDYVAYVRTRPGQKIDTVVNREGKDLHLTIVPKLSADETPVLSETLDFTGELRLQAQTGVMTVPRNKRTRLSLGQALATASLEPVRAVRGLFDLVRHPKNFDKSVGGPITMVKATEAYLQAGFAKVLTLAALLSISIGIMNLLPIGMLDGGQMVIGIVEMLRGGRRLSMQAQNAYGGFGLVAIALLMFSVMFVDVKRWFFTPDPPPLKIETKTD